MEKEVEDKPKDPNEADPDDYIDLCYVSISVPEKTPQEVRGKRLSSDPLISRTA